MLPAVSTALPNLSAANSAGAALLAQSAGDASAAARQFTQAAVTASAAPVAYFPGTTPARDTQNANKTQMRVPVPPPTGDYIVVDMPPPPPAAALRVSAPVTLGIPLTTQLTAQWLAQQKSDTVAMSTLEEQPQPTAAKTKDTSFATARGARAYGYAAQRSAAILAKPDSEAV